jgi:hypothetical protein
VSDKLLQLWCYYLNIKTTTLVLRLDKNKMQYQCFYPDSERHKRLDQAVRKVAEKCVVKTIIVSKLFYCAIFEMSVERT